MIDLPRQQSPAETEDMSPGETSDAYTDRLVRAGSELGINRQCSIGYHAECSDPQGVRCRCTCHAEASAPEQSDEEKLRTVIALAIPDVIADAEMRGYKRQLSDRVEHVLAAMILTDTEVAEISAYLMGSGAPRAVQLATRLSHAQGSWAKAGADILKRQVANG